MWFCEKTFDKDQFFIETYTIVITTLKATGNMSVKEKKKYLKKLYENEEIQVFCTPCDDENYKKRKEELVYFLFLDNNVDYTWYHTGNFALENIRRKRYKGESMANYQGLFSS